MALPESFDDLPDPHDDLEVVVDGLPALCSPDDVANVELRVENVPIAELQKSPGVLTMGAYDEQMPGRVIATIVEDLYQRGYDAVAVADASLEVSHTGRDGVVRAYAFFTAEVTSAADDGTVPVVR